MNLPPPQAPPPANPDGNAPGANGLGVNAAGGESVKGSFRIRNMLSTVKRTILDAGTVVGRYRIIEEIDRGGMAVVYKALQLDLDRIVALKVMPANVTINYRFVERFLSEAHSVAKLSHAGIVNIYEVATDNNVYYIAMEYIAGQNLYQYLNDAKPKLVDVLEIVSRLTEALSYAHGQKIIHRDLKLNNVIMKGPLTPVLIDFGLAKALEDSDSGGGITRTGEIMGSPAYMAPERLLGENVDHRSDICSLGIMLYEMLTFKNPYLDQRNLHQTTYNVMEANPIPPKKLIPWLPVEIEAITLKAMAKEPAMRYQSMDELRADIQRYQKGEAVLAKPPSFKKRTARFMRKKWAPLAISFLIMAFSGLLAVNHYVQSKKVMSHWQLVYSQQTRTPGDWAFADRDTLQPGQFEESARSVTLSAPLGGLSYARLERRFNRDILVEFELSSSTRDLFRAGVFLFDESPDSALKIYLNRDGAGASGIMFHGGDFLFQDIETGAIPWQANNTVAVERMNNAVTLAINGTQVAKVYDFFPPIGKAHEKLGFFVEGSEAVFSNIRVHRRAIPRVTSPTLIADRFWERGDFESAIDEYNGLMVDQSALNMAKELYIKIADCQLRLGRYEDALATLEKSAQMHGSDALKARARYLSGLACLFLGDTAKADGIFNIIARYYKYSPVNFSIMASALTQCAAMIDSGYADEALNNIKENTALYPKYAHLWGIQHLRLLNKQAKTGNLEMATKTANEIYAIYGTNSETAALAKTSIAEAYLNAGQTASAVDIYNQSIHTQNMTDNVWKSWYALAELYEYDFNYEHARSLYTKIWKESSASSFIHWMAALKCAEYQAGDSNLVQLDKVPLLHEIVNGDHPFPLPRLIASYYIESVTEIEFMNRWESLNQTESWCLYYIARKLLLQGNRDEAVSVVKVLERQYPALSWETHQIAKILRNEEKWK